MSASDAPMYFAACAPGLEPVVAAELRALGATGVEERKGGAAFGGGKRVAYEASLWLRAAIRVQELLLETEARGGEELYAAVRTVDWKRYLQPPLTLAVDAAIRDSEITHSGYAALRVKDAIVDQLRETFGSRPDVDRENPDVPLKLILNKDRIRLYRDLSGASLHKRGYRPIQVKSPLNEALAAGILLLSEWDRSSPLADPMCGSGTFVIEAALLAADRAPGLQRRFPFESWPDFDAALWRERVAAARAKARKSLPFVLAGADRHPGAVAIARQSAESAGVASLVTFKQADAAEWTPPVAPKAVFANPPYGDRIGEGDDLEQSWKALGNFLHKKCGGATAFVLSGNAALTKHLGLSASRKWPLLNGTIECRLLKYEIRAAKSRG